MKYFKLPLVAIAIALSMALCTKEKTVRATGNSKAWPYYWYTYTVDPSDPFYLLHNTDPQYWTMDEDQQPDCFNPTGYVRCSVRCKGDAWIENQPDFTTIVGIRYKPL